MATLMRRVDLYFHTLENTIDAKLCSIFHSASTALAFKQHPNKNKAIVQLCTTMSIAMRSYITNG